MFWCSPALGSEKILVGDEPRAVFSVGKLVQQQVSHGRNCAISIRLQIKIIKSNYGCRRFSFVCCSRALLSSAFSVFLLRFILFLSSSIKYGIIRFIFTSTDNSAERRLMSDTHYVGTRYHMRKLGFSLSHYPSLALYITRHIRHFCVMLSSRFASTQHWLFFLTLLSLAFCACHVR